MRAITMMKRNTDDNEEDHRWSPMIMMERKWNKQGETKWNEGERREMMKKKSEKSISPWIHANEWSMMPRWCVNDIFNHLMPLRMVATMLVKANESDTLTHTFF